MYIPSCEHCQRNKSSTKPPTSPLHPLPAPPDRGDFIAIDFVGPLPEDDGFNCVATMTDRLGADVRFIPTRNDITAEEFAAIFLHMRVDVATAQDNLTQAKIRQTIHANVHRRTEIVYQMGDEVLLSTMHRRRDYMGKGVRSFGQVVAVEPGEEI